MYSQILCVILMVSSPVANGFYFDIDVEIITSNNIQVTFSNLNLYDSYLFNWTSNPKGEAFQFDPNNEVSQTLDIKLGLGTGKGTIVFELYEIGENTSLLEYYSMYYNLEEQQVAFSIPFVDDIIDILTHLTLEQVIITVMIIALVFILQYYFRKGR